MLKKRIIPCLDIKDGQTVKGINFVNLRKAGDPLELAKRYVDEGADELVFLDISATIEKRKTLIALVEKIAREINIPFTVGGGINSVTDVANLLQAGADKVSINSAAVKTPTLISDLAKEFGSQCVVLAIDANYIDDVWRVCIHGGRTATDKIVLDWAKEAQALGAGEILLTSMQNDGAKEGFAINLLKQVVAALSIPVIASGGAGAREHFKEVFQKAQVDAALAASVFHFGEIAIPDLKSYLKTANIAIR